jgi:hypothetical protein
MIKILDFKSFKLVANVTYSSHPEEVKRTRRCWQYYGVQIVMKTEHLFPRDYSGFDPKHGHGQCQ